MKFLIILNDECNSIRSDFQDGVNVIYNKITGYGVTPTDRTPVSCANSIDTIAGNQYNSGRTQGQNDVTSNPNGYGLYNQSQYDQNYTNGYNNGMQNATSNIIVYYNQTARLTGRDGNPTLSYFFTESGNYVVIVISFVYYRVTVNYPTVQCNGGEFVEISNGNFSAPVDGAVAGCSSCSYLAKNILSGHSITAIGTSIGQGGESGSKSLNMRIYKLG